MNIQTDNEQVLAVARLMALIDNANKAIARHQVREQPDHLAVQQYRDLRSGYLEELSELMKEFGLSVEALVDKAA